MKTSSSSANNSSTLRSQMAGIRCSAIDLLECSEDSNGPGIKAEVSGLGIFFAEVSVSINRIGLKYASVCRVNHEHAQA